MNAYKETINLIRSNYSLIFLLGASVGSSFELFKIHFSFRGFDYYTSYERKQLPKDLEKFEMQLKEMDDILKAKFEPKP
uniref:Uncharacterized protein n=1 Tax=Rhabditophanes sp. KR3021 TaxID=114890 RepID=A0AC35TQP8_9BILA